MKKILSVLLASAALVGATGLVACGDNNKNNDDGVLRSEKIDSAVAWAAAMDFSEVKNGTLIVSGLDDLIVKYYSDGDKDKETWGQIGGETETDYNEYKPDEPWEGDPEQGTVYRYRYDEETSKWTVSASGIYDRRSIDEYFKEAVDELLEVYDIETGETSGCLSQRYADFTYDNSKYAYVASYDAIGDETTDTAMTDIRFEIKFKNGKAAEGKMSGKRLRENETETLDISFEIRDIGTTTVVLPQVSE